MRAVTSGLCALFVFSCAEQETQTPIATPHGPSFASELQHACATPATFAECEKLDTAIQHDGALCSVAEPPRHGPCNEVRAEQAQVRASPSWQQHFAAQTAQRDAEQQQRVRAQGTALGLADNDPPLDQLRRDRQCTMRARSDRDCVQEYLDERAHAAERAAAEQTAAEQDTKRQQARAVLCATTKASGIATGTYSGMREQKSTGRLDDHTTCQTTTLRSLTIGVGEDGCASWYGVTHTDMKCSSGQSMPTSCVERGSASFTKTSSSYSFSGTVDSRASGPAPARFHIWACGAVHVRTDMQADLKPQCTLLGNAAEPMQERVGDVVCASDRSWDDSVVAAATSVAADGTMRVTLKDGSAMTLLRIDRRQ